MQSGCSISSFLALSYNAISSVITAFLLGPTTTLLIYSSYFRAVSSVAYSCAGAANNGRACTEVMEELDEDRMELKADHEGTVCQFVSTPT